MQCSTWEIKQCVKKEEWSYHLWCPFVGVTCEIDHTCEEERKGRKKTRDVMDNAMESKFAIFEKYTDFLKEFEI